MRALQRYQVGAHRKRHPQGTELLSGRTELRRPEGSGKCCVHFAVPARSTCQSSTGFSHEKVHKLVETLETRFKQNNLSPASKLLWLSYRQPYIVYCQPRCRSASR